MELTQSIVKELFDYKDGFLYWKVNSFNKTFLTGKKAGYINHAIDGDRRMVRFMGKAHYTSRVIFLWHKGYLPKMVDHIDRNKLNENIENLRDATASQNQMNSSCNRGTFKYKGVSLFKMQWRARIVINGRLIHLGYFKSEIDAVLTYNKAAVKHFGEFANLNIIQKTN